MLTAIDQFLEDRVRTLQLEGHADLRDRIDLLDDLLQAGVVREDLVGLLLRIHFDNDGELRLVLAASHGGSAANDDQRSFFCPW